MTFEEQPGFDPRLAWASEGGTLLAGACPVLVVVDILRFTTAAEHDVSTAVPRLAGGAFAQLSWPG